MMNSIKEQLEILQEALSEFEKIFHLSIDDFNCADAPYIFIFDYVYLREVFEYWAQQKINDIVEYISVRYSEFAADLIVFLINFPSIKFDSTK